MYTPRNVTYLARCWTVFGRQPRDKPRIGQLIIKLTVKNNFFTRSIDFSFAILYLGMENLITVKVIFDYWNRKYHIKHIDSKINKSKINRCKINTSTYEVKS
ncbi:hypothetical protein PUN28_017125 [Cardiocondyla obscurior]|uniref:Uncharacterized protein n=1 Tax=Cardiocondyla obscurior TaxID=286306 RepID=A0AAW2ER95_9HYME